MTTSSTINTTTSTSVLCSVQLKLQALREDDNVFDVSYEGQGEEGSTVSATDVKVCSAR